MKQFFSKKWTFFASRPTPLLKRQFRNNWYLYVENISKLKVSEVLTICENGVVSMFVKKSEDKKNYLQAKKDFYSKHADKYFKSFKKIIEKTKLPDKNPFEKGIESHQKIGPILVYSHFFERILTEASLRIAKMNRKEKIRFKNLIKYNDGFRDKVVKIQDQHYDEVYKYIKKKYPRYKNIDYYLAEELITGKKINPSELNNRKKFYVQLTRKKRNWLYMGKKALTVLKREKFVKEKVASIKEFKGFPAYSGKVLGEVVIVKKLSDFKKETIGKIIISPMTIPQFVPYLKNVKAIVTDEGGINCHAAISAREFKIPCIVGTKIATKVLKDDDFVEMDANKGIIKIIK